jgi:hypothetical protein
MIPTTDGPHSTNWEVDQRRTRDHMVAILTNAVNFLERAKALESAITTPPGAYDGHLERLPTDFRQNRVYYCRLQSVWADLLTAMRQVGESIEFIRIGALPPEQLEPVLLDKEIVLEQFVANRLEAMLASPGAANPVELQKLLESANARIGELEDEQIVLPAATYFPNEWDSQADKLHHDGLHGWPYIDRAKPEDEEVANCKSASWQFDGANCHDQH